MSEVQSINIVEDAEGELRVSSLIIAGRTEVQHKNVMDLVRTYADELAEFGPLAFETRMGVPLPQGGFAKATEYALLSEHQATLLITFMRNSPIVREFKVELVKQFYAMRQALAVSQFAPHKRTQTRCVSLQQRWRRTRSWRRRSSPTNPRSTMWTLSSLTVTCESSATWRSRSV